MNEHLNWKIHKDMLYNKLNKYVVPHCYFCLKLTMNSITVIFFLSKKNVYAPLRMSVL